MEQSYVSRNGDYGRPAIVLTSRTERPFNRAEELSGSLPTAPLCAGSVAQAKLTYTVLSMPFANKGACCIHLRSIGDQAVFSQECSAN